jgi:pimeloyl-ACP methyl ester carboxylesterase
MIYRQLTTGRRSRAAAAILTLACTAGVVSGAVVGDASATPQHPAVQQPTVVLVHGAWADSSSWNGVVRRLMHDGYPVDVFPTPLRSLSGDSDALRDYLAPIRGPVVVVGHSYGGAVITDAATGDSAVRALVYIDAFAPDTGEKVLSLPGPDSALANPDPTQVFDFVPAALPPTLTTDLYVQRNLFARTFANDLPRKRAAVLAVTQRPVTWGALSQPSSLPAWRSIPSWYEIGSLDKIIPPVSQLAMAERAGAHISYARTGHLPMVSDPGAVTSTIERAAHGSH